MFDIEVENTPSYRESDDSMAGNEIVLADTELGRLGFAICYDLRFGEMFRLMALQGAQVIFMPASFTMNTGKDHWETLLRHAPLKMGYILLLRTRWDRKTICLPMEIHGGGSLGDVIARAGDRVGSILAEIDLEYQERVRRQIPSLENRRGDVYEVRSEKIRIC